MARTFGASGKLVIPASLGLPPNAGGTLEGTTEAQLTLEGDLEVDNVFGDAAGNSEKLIRTMTRCRGTFTAKFDDAILFATLVPIFQAADNTADGTFKFVTIDQGTDQEIQVPAFLSSLQFGMTRTGFHTMTGEFRSSGAVTGVNGVA